MINLPTSRSWSIEIPGMAAALRPRAMKGFGGFVVSAIGFDKMSDQYSDKEATRRMEDALRRALSTPHKPNKDFVGKPLKKSGPKAPTKAGASRDRS
jgi:hypothetical protein